MVNHETQVKTYLYQLFSLILDQTIYNEWTYKLNNHTWRWIGSSTRLTFGSNPQTKTLSSTQNRLVSRYKVGECPSVDKVDTSLFRLRSTSVRT